MFRGSQWEPSNKWTNRKDRGTRMGISDGTTRETAMHRTSRGLLLSAVLLASLAFVLVAGCGGPKQTAFLAKSGTLVEFVQWTRSGDSVTGSITYASLANDKVSSNDFSFSGTISDSDVTLTLDTGLGASLALNGTRSGSRLALNLPQDNGTLAAADFATASVADYNAAVGVLQQNANSASAAAQAQQATADQQNAIDNAVSSVRTDISSLGRDARTLDSDVRKFAQLLNGMRADVRTAYHDEQQTLADHNRDPNDNSGQVSYEASSVDSDVASVGSDLYTIGIDVTSAKNDLASAGNDLQTFRSDWTAMQSAMAAQPDYQPGNVPSADSAAAARAGLEKAIGQLQKSMAATRSEAKQLLSEAKGDFAAVKGYE